MKINDYKEPYLLPFSQAEKTELSKKSALAYTTLKQ